MLNDLISSPAFPLLTFLIGLLAGNRLAIGRDKRREFNKVIEPIRTKILDEADNPSAVRTAITRHDADAISERLGWRFRAAFLNTCEQYWDEKKKYDQDDNGEAIYKEKDKIRKIAHDLLKYVSIR